MFCTNCGKELSDDASYCPNCGTWFKKAETVKTTAQGNGMAIAGFVCSFFVPILGWVFGGIGLNRAAKRDGKGKGLSIAALAIASASFLFYLGVL